MVEDPPSKMCSAMTALNKPCSYFFFDSRLGKDYCRTHCTQYDNNHVRSRPPPENGPLPAGNRGRDHAPPTPPGGWRRRMPDMLP